MKKEEIIRAWRDEEFEASLDEKTRGLLPENPAGYVLLDDEELRLATGSDVSIMIESVSTHPSFCAPFSC